MKFTDLTQDTLAELAETAPSKIVVMVFDEAIASLRAAAKAAEEGDIMARLNATTMTAELVSQLRMGLDLENGGEIAVNLDSLYSFIVGRLPMIHLNNDAMLAHDLADLLVPLHQSWVTLDQMIERGLVDLDADLEMPGPALAPEELLMMANAG